MVNQPLIGVIACVTGATRGIGKGIALQLGEAGATVYVTGRTLKASPTSLGSLEETAVEIRKRGGKCIPVQVDHEDDVQIARLFTQIQNEQNGRLDILVNNAYKGVDAIFNSTSVKFWDQKVEIWDEINNVGLSGSFRFDILKARMMVARKSGLIVNISSYGGVRYLFNCAYGIGKSGVDRMAQDCGVELKKHGVTMLSLYPGAVKTELVTHLRATTEVKDLKKSHAKIAEKIFSDGESIEFSGRVIVAMLQDKDINKYTSKCVLAAEYAHRFGIRDIDNRYIYSVRQIKPWVQTLLLPDRLQFLGCLIPGFIKIPQFLLDIINSKF